MNTNSKVIDINTRLILGTFLGYKELDIIADQHNVSRATIQRIFYGHAIITDKNKHLFNAMLKRAKSNCIEAADKLMEMEAV
jgi:hypothetical protein